MIFIAFLLRFIYPELDLASSVIVYVNLIMLHTIENPDVKLLKRAELAKTEAEKANKHKTDFLSSMSHEIRTPLNAVIGLSEINMIESTPIEEIKSNNQDILNASHILLEIVGNVLDMSRIEAGNVEVITTEYKPYDIFDNVTKLIRHRFVDKGLDFRVNISPDIPKVLYGDHANLKKVLLNLLSNASKYTKKGYVDLTINSVSKNGVCRLIISVEYTGRGIEQKNIDKLFARFNRLDEDKNTTTEGTGLGLAITKHILELMGGTITAQSVYGKGSKFTVVLDQKIKSTFDLEDSKDDDEKVYTTQSLNLIANKKVLIVDDNSLNLKVAAKMLATYELITDLAESGKECLDKINNNNQYDLLLIDEMMPGMSGTEVMKELRKINYSVPMVVLTADVAEGSREKYINAGFDDYLKKPIEKNELKRVLYEYLSK
jgi:signal transduction histidine kinase/CheY-like chemotaxis protein